MPGMTGLQGYSEPRSGVSGEKDIDPDRRGGYHVLRFTVHGLRFTVHGLRFTIHGLRFFEEEARVNCPKCGAKLPDRRNPVPTVDIIIELKGGIVLIERKNPPPGWALPGGFVDYGESFEQAAVREAFEETGLRVTLTRQFHTYSDPGRDPRLHTATTVFIATGAGTPRGADDAARAEIFTKDTLPPLAFDHARILADYFRIKEGGISEEKF
jgi:8-oxo-dGTP diphosphatase